MPKQFNKVEPKNKLFQTQHKTSNIFARKVKIFGHQKKDIFVPSGILGKFFFCEMKFFSDFFFFFFNQPDFGIYYWRREEKTLHLHLNTPHTITTNLSSHNSYS